MGKAEMKEAVLLAKQLLFHDPEVEEKFKDLTEIKNFSDLLHSFELLWWFLKRIVYVVEMVYTEYHKCTEDERIEVASELLDDIITFKGWLSIFEPFDNMFWKLLLSAAVKGMNELFGHNWITNTSQIFPKHHGLKI